MAFELFFDFVERRKNEKIFVQSEEDEEEIEINKGPRCRHCGAQLLQVEGLSDTCENCR